MSPHLCHVIVNLDVGNTLIIDINVAQVPNVADLVVIMMKVALMMKMALIMMMMMRMPRSPTWRTLS